ncbi:MAG: hypothetical protein KDJ31_18180 [Candidatus Competibacteraceae bacterium]|nr:hypothetical protein [Candidatus Competibacteraceae bacterium]
MMNLMNTSRRVLIGNLSAAALLVVTSLPVYAQDELIIIEPVLTTMYLNGGVGESSEHYMHKIAKDWPLRMIFSERKDNEFVADVKLLVTDAQGVPYLQLSNAGPMTYAMLPAGKYRITAQFRGQSETREVTLDGKTGRDVYFHWKGDAK